MAHHLSSQPTYILDEAATKLISFSQDGVDKANTRRFLHSRLPADPSSLHLYTAPSTTTSTATTPPPPFSDIAEMFNPTDSYTSVNYLHSLPAAVFSKQASREHQRLARLIPHARFNEDVSLVKYDARSDTRANAENNVRDFWLECKIWRSNWGAAWKSGSHAMGGPNVPPRKLRAPRPRPKGSWAHESTRRKGTAVTRKIVLKNSRPREHFRAQVRREVDRLKDLRDPDNGDREKIGDVHEHARKKIKQEWIEDRLWRSEWDHEPGLKWNHEDGIMASVGMFPQRSVSKPAKRLQMPKPNANGTYTARRRSERIASKWHRD